MKPFDLESALQGEPVQLRNGTKAFVLCDLKDYFRDPNSSKHLVGITSTNDDTNKYECTMRWFETGKYRGDESTIDSNYDIIGMWEEPKLTSEQVLEKAYQEDLIVLCDGYPDLSLKVIAKTKNSKFVIQPENDTIQPWIADLTMEWSFADRAK